MFQIVLLIDVMPNQQHYLHYISLLKSFAGEI